jgi:hypothetical protein
LDGGVGVTIAEIVGGMPVSIPHECADILIGVIARRSQKYLFVDMTRLILLDKERRKKDE